MLNPKTIGCACRRCAGSRALRELPGVDACRRRGVDDRAGPPGDKPCSHRHDPFYWGTRPRCSATTLTGPPLRLGGAMRGTVRHSSGCRSVYEWNTAIHTGDHEARPAVRPTIAGRGATSSTTPTIASTRPRTRGKKGRKSVFRDATLFKMIYAFVAAARSGCWTFMTSPATRPRPSARPVRVCNVRWGKASRGFQPRVARCWRGV